MMWFNANGSYDSDGDIVRYEWDFGDGSAYSGGKNGVAHEYDIDGNYRVYLTVTDDDGLKDTSFKTIFIEGNAPPPDRESPKADKKRYDVSKNSNTPVRITGEIINQGSPFTLQIKNPNDENYTRKITQSKK